MAAPRAQAGGLSVPTLIIASLSSLAAALFIHKFWQGGAILGAAVTPIIVAIVSETLRKPVSRFESLREERRDRMRRGRETFGPPVDLDTPGPATPDRGDPFGIWEDPAPRRSLRSRLTRRHLVIAVVTGIAAFLIATVGLTAAELVFGGSAAGGDRKTTIFGGEKRDGDRKQRENDGPAAPQTEPGDIPETTPEDSAQPIEPGTTTTPPPAETTPETAPPPAETTPAPAPIP